MPPPRSDSAPGPSSTRLSRLLSGPDEGWTPTPTPTSAPPPAPAAAGGAAPAWRTALVAASPTALLWLAAAGLGIVLVTGFVLSRPHASSASGAARPPSAAAAAAVPVASSAPGIVVDVGGRVHRPGLVTLPLGARVADAIKAAGGALRQRDLLSINLAGRVADGQFVLVGVNSASQGSAGGAGPAGAGGAVSLNSATADQLDALPGVGPVLAQRIVTWREQHGGFASVDQLQQVPGIGARKYEDLKALVSP